MNGLSRLGASVVAMLAGTGLIAIPANPAVAAEVTATGWWYRAATANPTAEIPQQTPGAPTVPAIAPSPPTVAGDELHVEGSPYGATAIAAMTVLLDEDESSPVLTIEPAASSMIPAEALILACRAAVDWAPPPESPGTWESKPLVDCSTSVQAQPTEDGTLVFPLQMLVQGNLLDVVFVPGNNPALPSGAQGSSFSLTFAKPGPESLETTRAGDSSPSAEFLSEDFGPGLDTPLINDFAPFSGAADPLPAAAVAAALEPQEQAPTIPRVAPVAAPTPLDAAARTLGLLLLFVGAVGAYFAANQAPRQAIGLGRFRRVLSGGSPEAAVLYADLARPAAVVERGLGRLRRPRTGIPPAL